MVKKHLIQPDGFYHINGQKFQFLIGSRSQVMHGTAYKTNGGLKKKDFLYNKNGHIVSLRKHNQAKKDNRLVKAGYHTKKGQFGYVYKPPNGTKKRTHKKRTHKNKTGKNKRR